MKQITTYIADDGTVFDNYEDCYNYEFNSSMNGIIGNNICMFDENLNPIFDKITLDTGKEIFYRCAYVYLKDELALTTVKKFYNLFGYDFPEETGYWRYNYKNGYWISLKDEIENLRTELQIAEKEYRRMGGEI